MFAFLLQAVFVAGVGRVVFVAACENVFLQQVRGGLGPPPSYEGGLEGGLEAPLEGGLKSDP